MMSDIKAFGTWKVTTEGDCEGRTTRDLGTHEGYLDEIAFALADRAYYGLRFSQAKPAKLDTKKPTGVSVPVSLDIETGTWDLSGSERVKYFKKLLEGSHTIVKPSKYYACVELRSTEDPAVMAEQLKRIKRDQALAKLTQDEREALGF
jgi:hypothetical protein